MTPLQIGERIVVDPPVVLAPLAGITNVAFRRLCREYGAGLYISEMITSRALVERNPKTMQMVTFASDEIPRSMQLYGIDPVVVGKAVRMVVEENLADHVDLNFGCPVPKVTRRGGGSALPWRINLFDELVTAAVRATDGQIPVTVKMRLGVDHDHLTYREAALRAQDAGVDYVALHGRTAADFYGGEANWEPIAELAQLLDVPVLGNGDIWEASDAIRMVRETGCAGVVVGRGCLGRPWLFGDLAAAFTGAVETHLPGLDEVAKAMFRHARRLVSQGIRRSQGNALGDGDGIEPVRTRYPAVSDGPVPAVPDRGARTPARSHLGRTVGGSSRGLVGRSRVTSSAVRRRTRGFRWLDPDVGALGTGRQKGEQPMPFGKHFCLIGRCQSLMRGDRHNRCAVVLAQLPVGAPAAVDQNGTAGATVAGRDRRRQSDRIHPRPIVM